MVLSWDGRLLLLRHPLYFILETSFVANVTAGSITGPIVASFGLPTTVSLSHSFTGYDIGGEVEYAITNNWIGRGEYRYYDFGGWNHPTKAWVSAGHVNFSDNAVTVGLSYLFGAPAAAAPVVAKS